MNQTHNTLLQHWCHQFNAKDYPFDVHPQILMCNNLHLPHRHPTHSKYICMLKDSQLGPLNQTAIHFQVGTFSMHEAHIVLSELRTIGDKHLTVTSIFLTDILSSHRFHVQNLPLFAHSPLKTRMIMETVTFTIHMDILIPLKCIECLSDGCTLHSLFFLDTNAQHIVVIFNTFCISEVPKYEHSIIIW